MTDLTRSLTAIMFTDIVGYTSLTERDEAKAILVRERHRWVDPLDLEEAPVRAIRRSRLWTLRP